MMWGKPEATGHCNLCPPRIQPLPMDSSAYSFTAFAGVPAVEFSFVEVRLTGLAPEQSPSACLHHTPELAPPVLAGWPDVPLPAHEGGHL